MVVKTTKGTSAKEKDTVKKTITKNKDTKTNAKAGVVSKDFEITDDRQSGKVVHYSVKGGYGFIKLDTPGIVPDDKVMVHWREIQSSDRWPSLNPGLDVEFGLKKFRKDSEYTVKATEVSLPGGEQIILQEEREEKREYVGERNMRFLGNVKFYDVKKGFGYVKLQEGYDLEDDVPNEIRIDRQEINSGTDAPNLRDGMEIEFGIAKNKKGTHLCYNICLPGGDDITRAIVEERDDITTATFQGEVSMWSWKTGFGFIKFDLKKLPKKFQEAVKKDHEKRVAKAKKNNKEWPEDMHLYFRSGDKVDYQQRINKGDKVSFRAYISRLGVGGCEVKLV